MKIGVITIQKCNNYGADLQAFALQRKLQLMGYDAENIDYLFYKHPDFKKTPRSAPSFKLSIVNRIKECLLPKINALKSLWHREKAKQRSQAFEAFFTQYVRTSKRYRTMDELYADPPKYDVYVTGSDQVWNPRTGASVEPYFLTFAPKDSTKISYASSFGVSSLPPTAYYKYSKWLESYVAISMRESSGARIARQFIGCASPEVVCDPTLLLSAGEWSEVAKQLNGVDERKYLLVYDLSVCPGLWGLARRWAEVLKVPIVRICRNVGCDRQEGVVNIETAGPGEFVGLFKGAAAVVTTSFHGTAFSVIFNRPFYSVVPRGMTNSARISNLVDRLGISSRVVNESDCLEVELSEEVNDYSESLEKFRAQSVGYLRSAIG